MKLILSSFFLFIFLPMGATVHGQQSRGGDDPEKAYLLKSQSQRAQSPKSVSAAAVSLPLKMSYQGLLTTLGGVPLADGNYDFTVELYDSITNGTAQWTESQAGVPVVHGTFNMTLGNSTPLDLQFNMPLFVQIIATNGPAGPSYPLAFSPRAELTSAAYSLAPWVTKGSSLYYNGGKIGIGSAAPESSGIANLKLDIADESGASGNVALRVAGQNVDGGGFPQLDFAKSRGTLALPTSVNWNDFLGQVDFFGHDGGSYQLGAGIFAIVDSTPGPGIVPTRLTFYTSNQANGFAKRLQLDRNGSLGIDPWSYNTGNLSPGLTFGDGNYTGEGISSKRSSGGNLWGLDFYTAFLPRMSISNQGYVGVGTTTPSALLHVNDSTNSINGSRLMLTQATGGTTLYDGLSLIYTNPNGFVWNYEAGSIFFGTGNLERMRIASNGSVGVGTTSPYQKLTVDGTIGFKDGTTPLLMNAESCCGAGSRMLWSHSLAYADWGIYYNDASDRFDFRQGAGVEILSVGLASMRVGIGTTTPDQLLSVNGNASKVGGGSWATYSDRRLKQDITSFNDGLSVLTKIKPVTFRYNGKLGYPTDQTYVGVIAQEIQAVAPYTVDSFRAKLNPDDATETDILRFDPNALTYIAINAIKELNAKLKELEVLREANRSLSTRLSALESVVNAMAKENKPGQSTSLGSLK